MRSFFFLSSHNRNRTFLVEETLNFLMSQSLSRLFLPPYAYALDLWRWSVYNGSIQPFEYNKRYWDLV